MRCALCHTAMIYVHGHATCGVGHCPMFGQNQAPCCDGETADNCPVPTAQLAAGPAPGPGMAPLRGAGRIGRGGQ